MAQDYDQLENKAKEIFEDLYTKMDSRIKDLSKQLKDSLLPDTEDKLKKNIFKTILISFGAGFITGIIIMAFGFFSGKKR